MKLVIKGKTKLIDLRRGSLFLFGDTLCLKTEYTTDAGAVEAYIVGSGEFFWGGENRPKEQRELEVFEVEYVSEIGYKSSNEWAKLAFDSRGLVILDPDGWDRRNYEYSFHQELISEEEFENRLLKSTSTCTTNF